MADLSLQYQTHMTQSPYEFAELVKLVAAERVGKLLEIGSRFGGSLWGLSQAMPQGSLIVSVDSGRGQGGEKPGQAESLRACIEHLRQLSYSAHQIIGDSRDENSIRRARELGPYDMVFIDGDHSFEGVDRDWKNYGPMGRIVVFHDVAFTPPTDGRYFKPVEVPRLWAKIKRKYERTCEFIDPKWNMGIGVVWR